MRTISSGSLAKLSQNLGTEPINLVEIQWVANGERYLYGDKEATGVKAKILELGGLDSIIQVSGGSDSTEITLKLDDVDSEIKNIIDNFDANKRSVWVYQWFDGLALTEKFLIFRGEIRTPLVWDEGDRTVSFTVVSKIEDAEVGFSIEEGNFPQPPDDLIGKPWPLVFGTVCDVKALQATTPRQGILKTGVGISDFTLPIRICQAGFLLCPEEPKGQSNSLNPTDPNADQFGFTTKQNFGASEECASDRCQTIQELKFELTQQESFEYPTFQVIGGEKFPQAPTIITLDIEGAKFTGTFSGITFTIISRKHPDFDKPEFHDANHQPVPALVCRSISKSSYVQKESCSSNFVRLGTGMSFESPNSDCVGCSDIAQEKDGGAAASQKALDDMPTSSFFWARSGSKVTLDGEEDILYITNLLPSTINRVSAFRHLATGDKLMTLPTDMYEIVQTDYNGYIVTELVFKQLPSLTTNPVSKEVDGKWGDDIYVSQTSSVGPNTVDILQYLIEKYTNFDIDTSSFTSVKTSLTNYPSNFAILDRRNIVEVLREIAEQARCAIYLRDNTIFLKYLPTEPTSVAIITEDDVLQNSLKIENTQTEDLVTKYTATWKKSGAQDEADKIILRHNIKKYGTQDEEVDYYIYNIREYVLKSATFWLIRKANAWRRVSFQTPIKNLALEIFDCITLDLPDVAPSPIKAIVEKASFDSDNRVMDFTCWTPLKVGTTVPYIWAWPANITPTTKFPTQDEIDSGSAGSGGGDGFLMVPPAGHILSHTTTPVVDDPNANRPDWGDRFPSDLDDVIIPISCPSGPDVDLNDETEPVIKAFKRAARASRQADTNAENAGQNSGGGNQDKKKTESGLCGTMASTAEGNCQYSVKVTYGRVESVATPFPNATPGAAGPLVNATPTAVMCHVFGSSFAAIQFVQYMLVQIISAQNATSVGANIPLTAINAGSAGGAPCAAKDLAQGNNPDPTRDKETSQYAGSGANPTEFHPSSDTEAQVIINEFVVPNP